jgi:hypothetical protein
MLQKKYKKIVSKIKKLGDVEKIVLNNEFDVVTMIHKKFQHINMYDILHCAVTTGNLKMMEFFRYNIKIFNKNEPIRFCRIQFRHYKKNDLLLASFSHKIFEYVKKYFRNEKLLKEWYKKY